MKLKLGLFFRERDFVTFVRRGLMGWGTTTMAERLFYGDDTLLKRWIDKQV